MLHGLHAFLPSMLAHGQEAHIVNTSSTNGLRVAPNLAPYGVSKYAVMALTEALYYEMRQQGTRIGVSVLCPGPVDTNGWKSMYAVAKTVTVDVSTAIKERMSSGMDPDEVAAIVETAIRANRLYVITHPDFVNVVAERARHIVEQTNPT
jgi:short-subunit dehydrogenase